MKSTLNGINNSEQQRLATTKENISELEDIGIETIQRKQRKNRKLKQSTGGIMENFTEFNICIIGCPKKDGA